MRLPAKGGGWTGTGLFGRVESPDLGHAQGGVDAQAVERAMGDVHFDGEVGRRVGA